MAFTALYFPRDNDPSQLSMWSDNGEQTITGDNFSDFISFDSEDATILGGEDPPTPSALLDNLQNEFSNHTTYPLDLSLGDFHPEIPATAPSKAISAAPVAASADQVGIDSAPALAIDPILGAGSISDSELLRLEGISIKSSPHRGTVTAPSSPMSPRKKPGFFSTLRRKAHRPKPAVQEQFQPIDTANTDNFLGEPNFFDLNYNEFADQTIPIKPEPVESHGLLSPPPTGRIPNERQRNPSGFVSGHLDDPFCDNPLDIPASIKQEDINTPMDTPIANSETFSHNQAMTPLNTNVDSFRHPQKAYRRTSSAKWPTEGYLTDARYNEDPNMWSSASSMYVADNGNGNNISNYGWWDGSPTAEMLHTSPTHQHPGNGGHNMSMHNQQQAEMAFEYNNNNNNAELTGLMIHMPQPRGPQASVLNPNLNEHVLATPHHIQGTPRGRHVSGYHGNGNSNGNGNGNGNGGKGYGHHTDVKRPRPRAPSSGARHHHHHAAQTSPRKLRNSHSLGYLREESQSPSPMVRQRHHPRPPPHPHPHPHPHAHSHGHGPPPPPPPPPPLPPSHQNHQERRQHRSASLTMRKQRSFTRRASSSSFAPSPGGLNTNTNRSTSTSTSTSTNLNTNTRPGSRSGGGGGGSGGGGGGRGGVCVDFVNFTPSDSNLLMTGVAPSGSSKTKARREKEAQEREKVAQEKLLEVFGKAVGGDVRKLIGDFNI
ncbi:hypothetical protein F5Y09DRAFT_330518 [Xylaria sp. FL1042]|nr:hypothetical protein F5Y09DRAFT_330518 [Xylaria sp. FL1042]